MFNLGFSEMAIIAALALIVLGPKQMPELAKALGRMIREFKNATADLSGGLLEVKEDLKKPFEDTINGVRNTAADFKDDILSDIDPGDGDHGIDHHEEEHSDTDDHDHEDLTGELTDSKNDK